MNEPRFRAVLAGQTAIAQKVYNAVPISDRWSARQIHDELVRGGACSPGLHVMNGCLGRLRDAGLIVGSLIDGYSRTPVRERKEKVKEQQTIHAPAPKVAPQPEHRTPLELLAALSDRVSGVMAELKVIASDIDTTALEIAGQMEKHSEDTRKLEQLRALLKGLA